MNLRDLDLKLLVVFEAIYSTGNISRAADKLAMSQPAVSNQLARLRDLIGDPLFARGRRGVEPTVKAQTMIGPVREALGLIGRQFGDADAIDLATYRRTFRISLFELLEPILMPPIVNMIAERAPGISLEGSSPRPEFAQDILNGTLDLVCYAYPITSPDISVVPIAPIELVVIARRNHPGIGTTLDLEALGSLGYIGLASELRQTTLVDRDLLQHGIKRRVVYGVPRLWSIPAQVTSSDLIAIMPRAFAAYLAPKFDLDIHEMPVKIPAPHIHMAWHIKMDGDPGHKWLREAMLTTARERLGNSRRRDRVQCDTVRAGRRRRSQGREAASSLGFGVTVPCRIDAAHVTAGQGQRFGNDSPDRLARNLLRGLSRVGPEGRGDDHDGQDRPGDSRASPVRRSTPRAYRCRGPVFRRRPLRHRADARCRHDFAAGISRRVRIHP